MAQVGDVDEKGEDADWDDDESHVLQRATMMPNYGITNNPVDLFIGREMFLRLTHGLMGGDRMAPTGFELDAANGGNLVLNPWYALHGWDANNGLTVPTALAGVGDLRLRRPAAAGGDRPSNGRQLGDGANGFSENRFQQFYEYLAAFGYKGEKNFCKKEAAAVNHISTQAEAAVVGSGITYTAYANNSTPIPNATEASYTGYLNQAACAGSMRGHPDYSHRTYWEARQNFHRFFILYISGRAQMLPAKAKEFFDNFNWQGFQCTDADRANTFKALIQRIYNFERSTAMVIPGEGLAGIQHADLGDFMDKNVKAVPKSKPELVIVRPNIEHNMLGIIMVSSTFIDCLPCFIQGLTHGTLTCRGGVVWKS
jgi:hypothetical protein